MQCFKLSLTANNDHAESYNNLGVLEMRKGRVEQARAFFQVYLVQHENILTLRTLDCGTPGAAHVGVPLQLRDAG